MTQFLPTVEKLDGFADYRAKVHARRKLQLNQYDNDTSIAVNFRLHQTADNQTILVWRDTGEEVVLDVQGLVAKHSLPPWKAAFRYVFRRHPAVHLISLCRHNDRRAHLFRQCVSVVGPGSAHFSRALSAMQRIYKYFGQSFAADVVNPLQSLLFEGLPCIEAGTRYLTLSKHSPTSQTSPIPPSIDPDGVLYKYVQSGQYRFTEDNLVNYVEVVPDDTKG
jgi:hypothetical protein